MKKAILMMSVAALALLPSVAEAKRKSAKVSKPRATSSKSVTPPAANSNQPAQPQQAATPAQPVQQQAAGGGIGSAAMPFLGSMAGGLVAGHIMSSGDAEAAEATEPAVGTEGENKPEVTPASAETPAQ